MHPQPLFTIFDKGIYLYGICIGVGLILCILCFFFFSKKRGMPENVQEFSFVVAIIAIAAGFLFAKLFQAVYNWIDTGKFDFYGAGITVMGGLIGGAATFILAYFVGGKLYFRGNLQGIHLTYFKTILIVAPICILIAHAFGRIGCLMAGCCHGAKLGDSYVFGSVARYYYNVNTKTTTLLGYYIPTQLYESLFLFVAFGACSWLCIKGANFTMPVYLISYGVFRFLIEFLRTDYRGFSGGLSPSQIQSILFVAGGIAYFVVMRVLKIPFFEKKDKEEIPEKN